MSLIPKAALACAATTAVALAAGAVPAQAEERALELVTPGAHAQIRAAGGGPASADGNTLCYASEEAQLGAPPNGSGFNDDAFCARRGATGWVSEWVSQPQVPGKIGSLGMRVFGVTSDGRRVAVAGDTPIAGFPDFTGEPGNAGSRPNTSTFLRENGTLTWATPRPPTMQLDWGWFVQTGLPLALTPDVSHIVFESSNNLLPADTNPQDPLQGGDVYMWSPEGLQLVSQKPDGTAVGGASVEYSGIAAVPGSLSRDGRRVFFKAPNANGHATVYLYEDGDVSVASPRRGPGGTSPANITFGGASDDGDLVYLTTEERLTPAAKEDGAAVYRYDVEADELELVVTVPGGVTLLAVSGDGSAVLYTATDGSDSKLYARRDGGTATIATLAPEDSGMQAVASNWPERRGLRLSRDGRTLVLASAAGLAPEAPAGTMQVYRWRLGAGVELLSKRADGAASTRPAAIGGFPGFVFPPTEQSEFDSHTSWANKGRVVSDDGERIFFTSSEPLTDADRNTVQDVYEWHDGTVALLSGGAPSDTGAYYQDSSADGSTVFFTTYRTLLPHDRNAVRDVYAARVGGGFPAPPDSPVGKPANQGAPGTPPASVGGESTKTGSPEQAAARRLVVAAPSRGALAKAARTGRLRLSAHVSGAATVTLRAGAKLGKRTRTVARARAEAAGSGTVTLTARLSAPARKAVARTGRLRVRVVVRASGVGEAERLTLNLRRRGTNR